MIIPQVNLNEVDAFEPRDCWFGKLSLGADMNCVDATTLAVKQLGGRVDLQIRVNDIDAETSLSFLNAGASEIVIPLAKYDSFSKVIPADRLRVVIDDVDTDLSCIKSPIQFEFEKFGDLTALEELSRLHPRVQVLLRSLSPSQIAELHHRKVGCVLSRVQISDDEFLADCFTSLLTSDRADGLWPTVIVDELGTALGLAYSNRDSLKQAFETGAGVYWSRSRNEIWAKGKTSGASQSLLGIAVDCDADCLRFRVSQEPPGFCHRNTYTCFGAERNVQAVLQRLKERMSGDDPNSFTLKLARDQAMLEKKLLEEAKELADATSVEEVTWEAADLVYFAMIRLLDKGGSLDEVFAELTRRMNRVVRRPNKLETIE